MKLELDRRGFNAGTFQLLLKGCTIEAGNASEHCLCHLQFQLLLKGCTIEASWNGILLIPVIDVSVVVERMYD